MNELVFLTDGSVNAKLYTTGDVIAQYAKMTHRAINDNIETYKKDLQDFGVLTSETSKPLKGSKGGRPRKIWHLNMLQATTLIALLGNSRPIVFLKKALVKQFYEMREALINRRVAFQFGKQSSKGLNDAIANSDAFEDDSHAYSNLNRLMYKQALGMNTAQIKKLRDIPEHQAITEYLTADEAAALSKVKSQTSVLVELGMDYKQIKATLANQGIIYQIKLEKPQQAITG